MTTCIGLVDEQSALREVATAVAGAATPEQVFDLVCRETGRLFDADTVNLVHFTPDGVNLTMAGWSGRGVHMPVGTRLPLDGAINELVRRTGAPGRFDTYDGVPGKLAQRLRGLGIRSEVGAPVVVGGHVWGALIAGTDRAMPLPVGTEDRLARFAELIGTAVGNAADRAELVASRARIVAAGDAARLRLARDLHDGAQQRLVSVVMSLQLADQQRDDPVALASPAGRGAGQCAGRDRGPARAGRRHAPDDPDQPRVAGRGPQRGRPLRGAGHRHRARRAIRPAGRGCGLLRHRRGAHQYRQARCCFPGGRVRGAGARRADDHG